MLDVLILEDGNNWSECIQDDFRGKNINYRIVKDSREFRDFLTSGEQAKLYFLDDSVPSINGEEEFLFLEHCSLLLEKNPEAKVIYTGSVPGKKQKEFCKEHEIELLNKGEIYEYTRKNLK